MTLALVRVDDRLVHGQVVVGWGRALGARRIVLVDDEIAAHDWERDLYRMGVPPDMAIEFASVADAAGRVAEWEASAHPTIVVLGEVAAAVRFSELAPQVTRVNLGGIHQGPGRRQRLPYVFMSDAEACELQRLAARGIEVTAQDVPTARAVPFEELA